jgi:hypothetical protein
VPQKEVEELFCSFPSMVRRHSDMRSTQHGNEVSKYFQFYRRERTSDPSVTAHSSPLVGIGVGQISVGCGVELKTRQYLLSALLYRAPSPCFHLRPLGGKPGVRAVMG